MKDKNWSNYGLILFLGGLIIPIILYVIGGIFDKKEEIEIYVIILSVLCEVFALIFALISRKERTSKIVLIGILVIILLVGWLIL